MPYVIIKSVSFPASEEVAAEVDRLRGELAEIRDYHLGDCPASADPFSFAVNHVANLRKKAHYALRF